MYLQFEDNYYRHWKKLLCTIQIALKHFKNVYCKPFPNLFKIILKHFINIFCKALKKMLNLIEMLAYHNTLCTSTSNKARITYTEDFHLFFNKTYFT